MDDQTYFNLVAGILVVLVLVTAGVTFAVVPAGTVPARTVGAGQPGPTVYRNITISYDPSTGGFVYSMARLAVPFDVRVIFTITNFDATSASLPTVADANVVGTDGSTMQVINGGGSVSVGGTPSSEVSHTFSMSDGYYALNVPIPRADEPSGPVLVTFSVVFPFPGTFTWGCVVLCGAQDMHASNSMYGTLTVS